MEFPSDKSNNQTLLNLNSSNVGFGGQFKAAREAKNLTIDEIAGELNILNRHLDAIERSDFDSLPQIAFTRGFVSSYAKFLKLDVQNVLTHFNSVYPQEKKLAQVDISKPDVSNKSLGKVSRTEAKKANFGRFGGVLVLLGLIGLGAVYFITSQNKIDTNEIVFEPTTLEQIQTENQVSIDEVEQVNDKSELAEKQKSNTENTVVNSVNVETTENNTNKSDTGIIALNNAGSSIDTMKAGELITYKIKRGDGLIALATKHGVSVEELAKLNNMKPTQNLLLGQTIKVPNNIQ